MTRRRAPEAWVAAVLCWLAFSLYAMVMLRFVSPRLGYGLGYFVALALVGWALLAVLVLFDRGVLDDLRCPGWQYATAVALLVIGIVVRVVVQRGTWAGALTRAAVFLLAVSVVEEVAFRGFIWRRVEQATGSAWWAWGVSTVLFWAMHLPNWVIQQSFSGVGATFTLFWGALLGIVRLWTRGLALPIAFHAGIDLIGS